MQSKGASFFSIWICLSVLLLNVSEIFLECSESMHCTALWQSIPYVASVPHEAFQATFVIIQNRNNLVAGVLLQITQNWLVAIVSLICLNSYLLADAHKTHFDNNSPWFIFHLFWGLLGFVWHLLGAKTSPPPGTTKSEWGCNHGCYWTLGPPHQPTCRGMSASRSKILLNTVAEFHVMN